MINKIIAFIRKIYIEAIIVLLLALCINIILGNSKDKIHSDGIGYYEYLPSIIIFHDLYRKDIPWNDSSELYKRIESKRHYKYHNDYKVNKYSCGTALLQAPFFLITYSIFNLDHTYKDGYQQVFHETIGLSAFFYLFLTLCLLKGLLQLYEIKKDIIIFSQLILVFSTSVIAYVSMDASFSHIYSLCAITAFLYITKKYFLYKHKKLILIAGILVGLIMLLRPVNFLTLLFLPFLAASGKNLKESIISLYKELPTVSIGIILGAGVFSIQLLLWYFQTGDFILDSYEGQTFDFTNPQFINVLFSYRKGLFVYTPIFLLSIAAVIWMFSVRYFYMAITWMIGFILLTYVLSSWWCWFYGSSYGLRAYIDYYTLFLIPMAIFVQQQSLRLKFCVIIFSICTIVLNMIQTYQYKEHILHGSQMDKEKYWKIFLKTDEKYKYILSNEMIPENEYVLLKEYQIGEQVANNKILRKSLNEIPNVNNVDIVQISIEDVFDVNDESRIELSLIDTLSGKQIFFYNPPIIQFAQKGFNFNQVGIYNFNLSEDYKKNMLHAGQSMIVKLDLMNGKKSINNISIRFLHKK
ncbi:hypothetical protein [Cytophaga aurantiaca]|uniref:hypothetical protein n=1 Tax=Cytophaga aurantiaca TaxID=29530 RepID=UPI0003676409|nr:hypothetical protein [Cytophaga aurantiaca]